jgi:hypothetical protein
MNNGWLTLFQFKTATHFGRISYTLKAGGNGTVSSTRVAMRERRRQASC